MAMICCGMPQGMGCRICRIGRSRAGYPKSAGFGVFFGEVVGNIQSEVLAFTELHSPGFQAVDGGPCGNRVCTRARIMLGRGVEPRRAADWGCSPCFAALPGAGLWVLLAGCGVNGPK